MVVVQAKDGNATSILWRLIGWSVPVVLLLLPLIAGAPWTASDYVMMGLLLACVGTVAELAVRASSDRYFRAGVAVAVMTGFLLVWINLAVGLLGDEHDDANAVFLGVVLVAVVGGLCARLSPVGMARAMLATALAQLVAGGLAVIVAGRATSDLPQMALISTLFAALWLAAAALFAVAARRASRG